MIPEFMVFIYTPQGRMKARHPCITLFLGTSASPHAGTAKGSCGHLKENKLFMLTHDDLSYPEHFHVSCRLVQLDEF